MTMHSARESVCATARTVRSTHRQALIVLVLIVLVLVVLVLIVIVLVALTRSESGFSGEPVVPSRLVSSYEIDMRNLP